MGHSQNSTILTKSPEQYRPKKDERRSQSRKDGVLSKIEDATYEVLRKHEKKSA
jgi:membrane carboxypeptidase/penicillin-binding protein